MSDEAGHGARLTRVETEVEAVRTELGGIKTEVAGIKTGMRGLGDILQRIEQSVASAQERHDDERRASRMNPIAFASILITIITILVGGSWTISGELARHDERSEWLQQTVQRIDQRQWELHHVAKPSQ